MDINVEHKGSSGQVQNKTMPISKLAFIKHMAIAGQGFIPSIRKLQRTIGMFFRFSDYLNYNAFNASYFSTPPPALYDPTETAQFSNIVGKAFADYLAKKLDNAKITFNYEAMMRLQGIAIQGSRPDLIAYRKNKNFALEAKGFSDPLVSSNKMIRIKNQSAKGPIQVSFSVASVAYNLYSSVKVKYHDPDGDKVLFDKNILNKLAIQYYSGILEYLNKEIFSIDEEEIEIVRAKTNKEEKTIEREKYYVLSMKHDNIMKVNLLDSILHPFPPFVCIPNYSILISERVKKYAKDGFANEVDEIKTVDTENMYIDADGIGLKII